MRDGLSDVDELGKDFLRIFSEWRTHQVLLAYYVSCSIKCMIRTWANGTTERFATAGKSKFSGMDEEFALDRLAALDAATALSDLSPLKSVNLHPLKGDRKGQWAMNINGPWRICFRFQDGDAWDVEITDYH